MSAAGKRKVFEPGEAVEVVRDPELHARASARWEIAVYVRRDDVFKTWHHVKIGAFGEARMVPARRVRRPVSS